MTKNVTKDIFSSTSSQSSNPLFLKEILIVQPQEKGALSGHLEFSCERESIDWVANVSQHV